MENIVCPVCMHHCKLSEGQWGICRARKNENGIIVCKNYGRITSLALDPIEKKPLNMFYPGSRILSAGSFGCNLRCPFCQNHEISMSGEDIVTRYIPPQELAQMALEYKSMGNIGVAFTYNEPLIGWEYVLDTAKLVRENGMKNVLVTNGTLFLEILEDMLPFIDAMNIDLKGFTKDYYQKVGGSFDAVKEFIARAAESCHIELTTLIVPNENDSVSDMEKEAQWILDIERKTGRSIPLHVTRFFPRYRMQDREATDVKCVYKLAETAGKYLENVFVGNC